VIIVNALQYVAVLAGFLLFPLIVTHEAQVSAEVAGSVLSWSMIVLAIGTTRRLRSLLSPELAGLVILLVAIGNGMVTTAPCWQKVHSCRRTTWTVAAITLQVSCALIGMIIGFATAFSTGLLSQADLAQLTALPPLQVPHVDYWAWSFDAVL